MKSLNKTGLVALIIVISAALLFAVTSYALPAAYINEGLEDATGTTDASQMFNGTQLWIGNEADLKQMAADGKVGISAKSSATTKNYVIDGNKSIFAVNYLNNNQTGSPYKEWCNIWMTHDSNFGLKNSSTYVISFLMRTYTQWEPESKGALQNFAVVSIRNFRYKGGASLVDFYVQPNIQSSDVTPDQMYRVADNSVPANSKNTMSIKKLNDNTFSVVCKFVTSVPTTDVTYGNDKWFAAYTFHGPGVIACDNIKVYQSDLALSSFHQKLPAGSTVSTRENSATNSKTAATGSKTEASAAAQSEGGDSSGADSEASAEPENSNSSELGRIHPPRGSARTQMPQTRLKTAIPALLSAL